MGRFLDSIPLRIVIVDALGKLPMVTSSGFSVIAAGPGI